jgi:dihydropyrimidinase/dihydroorotase
MLDLVIRGGRVVSGRHTTPPVWVGVEGGRIIAIGGDQSWPEAKRTIDASGKYVLPGVIDPEQHPNPPDIEGGILSETRAALASGVTTTGFMAVANFSRKNPEIYDERNTAEDVPTFMQVYPEWIKMAKNRCMNDYFLIPQVSTMNHAMEVPELAEKFGVVAWKLYLHTKTGQFMWDMWRGAAVQGFFYYDDELIFRIMRSIAALGPPAMLYLHCENYEIARVLKEDLIAQGRTDMKAWDDKSPAFCEAGHIRNYAYYGKVTGCPICIIHTTTPESIEEIRKARAEGTEISGYVQPNYLASSWEAGPTNVPLRSPDNWPILWKAIRDGIISYTGSDHYWQSRSEADLAQYGLKKAPDSVWESVGFAGSHIDFYLTSFLSEGVNKGNLSLERVVEVLCENNAKLNGLYPKKGVIAVGSDADIAIVDLNKKVKVSPEMIVSRMNWSVYEGREFTGWPVMTILRGNVMMEWPEGEPRKFAEKPIGEYIPRKPGQVLYPLD